MDKSLLALLVHLGWAALVKLGTTPHSLLKYVTIECLGGYQLP
ncbi:hypothetical protein VCHA40P242_30355 [Vibrio chagasii]|nr:hypothetical protein VCHA36P164_20360 [Vibrio chagasii]CAH7236133.1 hypothetical protein VCHA40P242_30355 [Vibrio chagasii]